MVSQQRLQNNSANEVRTKLENLRRSGATVFVLICLELEVLQIMQVAAELGMASSNTWLFTGNLNQDSSSPLLESMQGLIGTRWSVPSEQIQDITNRLRALGDLSNDRALSMWTPFLMDAVTTVGLAAQTLQASSVSPFNSQALFNAMQRISFDGKTGRVSFDQNGDRVLNVSIINVQAASSNPWVGTTVVAGQWRPLPRTSVRPSDFAYSDDPLSRGSLMVDMSLLMWPDGTNIKPWGTPSILHVVALLDRTDKETETLQMAMQVAVDNVNLNPSFLPRTRIQLAPILYDGDSGLVPAAVQATLDPLCVAVLGPHGLASQVEKAHGPLEGARVPHFDFSTSTAFPQAAPPFFIRGTTGDAMFAQAASDFIGRLQVTRICIVISTEGQGSRLQLLQKYVPANITVVSVTLLEPAQNASYYAEVTRNFERFGIRAVVAWIEDPEVFQNLYNAASLAGVGAADNVTWVVPGASRLLDYINNGAGDDARFTPDGRPVARFTPLDIMELVGTFLIAPQLRREWTDTSVPEIQSQLQTVAGNNFLVINETAVGSDYFDSPLAGTDAILAQDAIFQIALHISALAQQRKDPLNGQQFINSLKGTDYYYVSQNTEVTYRIGRSKPVTVNGVVQLHHLKTDETLQRVLNQDIFNVGSEGRVVKAGTWALARQLTLDGTEIAYANGLSSPPRNVPCNFDWGFDPLAKPQNQCSPCAVNSTFDAVNWRCGAPILPPSKAYLRGWTIGGWLLVIVTIVVFILGFCYGLYDNGCFESSASDPSDGCWFWMTTSLGKCVRCVARFFCCAVCIVAAKLFCSCLLGPLASCHRSRKSFQKKMVHLLQSALIMDILISIITVMVDFVNIAMNWTVGIVSWVPVVEVNIWTIIAYFLCLLFSTILFVSYLVLRLHLFKCLFRTIAVAFETIPSTPSSVLSPLRSPKNIFSFSPKDVANSSVPSGISGPVSVPPTPFSPKALLSPNPKLSADLFSDPKDAILRAGEGLTSAKRWTRLHEFTIYLAFCENLVCLGFASLYFEVRGVGWNDTGEVAGRHMEHADLLMSVAVVINLLQFGHRVGAFDWQVILHETEAAFTWMTESPYSFFPLHNRKLQSAQNGFATRNLFMSPMPSVPERNPQEDEPLLQLPPDRIRARRTDTARAEEQKHFADEFPPLMPEPVPMGSFLASRRRGMGGSEVQLQRLPPALV